MDWNADIRGWDDTQSELHDRRLDAAIDELLVPGIRSVGDLGCGSGSLLERLVAEPRLERIVGVEPSADALAGARERLERGSAGLDPRVTLVQGSVLDPSFRCPPVDAAALIEVLEHLDPGGLSRLETAVFARLPPRVVVLTTPNREYNVVYGLAAGEMRHPHHRFEWDRRRFERWASGVAARSGYDVAFRAIGDSHRWHGSPTQMAVFRIGA